MLLLRADDEAASDMSHSLSRQPHGNDSAPEMMLFAFPSHSSMNNDIWHVVGKCKFEKRSIGDASPFPPASAITAYVARRPVPNLPTLGPT
ncbi:hypothetical protein FS749_000440 [Ceratobasidium sp. UAMH 11750]|nr:hypothetical protein FS749_000440 [Ceratobasidium sp. UAMH 11750]